MRVVINRDPFPPLPPLSIPPIPIAIGIIDSEVLDTIHSTSMGLMREPAAVDEYEYEEVTVDILGAGLSYGAPSHFAIGQKPPRSPI